MPLHGPCGSGEALSLSLRISKEKALIVGNWTSGCLVRFKEQNGKRMNHHEAGQVSNIFLFQKKKSFGLPKLFLEKVSHWKCSDNYMSGVFKYVEGPSTPISHVCFLNLHMSCLTLKCHKVKAPGRKRSGIIQAPLLGFLSFPTTKTIKFIFFLGSSLWVLESKYSYFYPFPI